MKDSRYPDRNSNQELPAFMGLGELPLQRPAQ
jgi:hypothetical protein